MRDFIPKKECTNASGDCFYENRCIYAFGKSEKDAKIEELRAALAASMLAIDDLIILFGSEFNPDAFDEKSVQEAKKRIYKKGAYGYTRDIQRINKKALREGK